MTQVLAALLRHDAVELKRVAQDGTRVRASAWAVRASAWAASIAYNALRLLAQA